MLQKINLPYSLNALEPFYSRETLDIHYNTLYTAYIDNTNKTEEKLKLARKKNDFENVKCLEKELSYQGSGVILHELFFQNMTSVMQTRPSMKLMDQINQDFGTFASFKSQFTASSKVVEASGWNLLVYVPQWRKLKILQCEKHQNLTLWGCIPLLVLDMWEHSYFLQYKANRAEYVSAFWNIVDWNVISKRFEKINI